MSRLPLVKIGIVGLDSDWLESLRPAIDKMQSRVRVVAVYDDRTIVAQEWAQQSQAKVVLGIRPLLERSDVDAILLGMIGWQGDWLLGLLHERNVPVLFGSHVSLSERQLDNCHRVSVDEGTVMIPELRLRYLPATLRLRELQATTLGPVQRMVIHPEAWSRSLRCDIRLTHLLDWCTALIGHAPDVVEPLIDDPSGTIQRGVRVSFRSRRLTSNTIFAEAVLVSDASTGQHPDSGSRDVPLCEVECESGTLTIIGPNELHWTAGDESHEEHLTNDRSSTEVVLDLFARRVLGGLIPTPDLGDLKRAHSLATAVRQTQTDGKRIELNLSE